MVYIRRLSSFFKSGPFWILVLVGNLFLMICVSVVYFLERNVNPKMDTFFEALWWGVATITTVGYGDIVPATREGRIIGLVLMYTGTVLFIAFTSLIAATLVRGEVTERIGPVEKEVEEEMIGTERVERHLREIAKRLDRIEGK